MRLELTDPWPPKNSLYCPTVIFLEKPAEYIYIQIWFGLLILFPWKEPLQEMGAFTMQLHKYIVFHGGCN